MRREVIWFTQRRRDAETRRETASSYQRCSNHDTKCYSIRMSKQAKSPALAAVHEMIEDAFAAGTVGKRTMREFDKMCLTEVLPLSPADIKALRTRELASQTVFARVLNVTPGLVSQWERGEKRPSGAALKLLTLVEKKGMMAVA
jgi:putative transcriptional regulator